MVPGYFNAINILTKLLKVRSEKTLPNVKIGKYDLKSVISEAQEIVMNQPMLLELNTPIQVVGDIHGQFFDLLKLFDLGGFPPDKNYLFLGDYVDRGKQSVETMILLVCYKVVFPANFFMLRGNHEDAAINRIYGFYSECRDKYDMYLWKEFIEFFNCLPVAAIIDNKIFCCHGGLSPDLKSLNQIRYLSRPSAVPDSGLLCDLLWSDPDKDTKMWGENSRGVSYVFGQQVVEDFLNKNKFDFICRAHQVISDGYEFSFGRKLVTLFSAPNYCGEFDNAAGMLEIDNTLSCKFQILTSPKETNSPRLSLEQKEENKEPRKTVLKTSPPITRQSSALHNYRPSILPPVATKMPVVQYYRPQSAGRSI